MRFSPNSVSLQVDYVTEVEDKPIMSVQLLSLSSSFPLLAKTNAPCSAVSAIAEHLVSLSVRTKKGHYKKSQKGYISPICGEFTTQPNLTKIGIRVGVAEVINRTDERILPCSI